MAGEIVGPQQVPGTAGSDPEVSIQTLSEVIAAVESAGVTILAVRHGLIWFTDPQTRSTLALNIGETITRESVRAHLARSRAKFAASAAARS